MCWMTVRSDGDIERAIRDIQAHEGSNGQSWGVGINDGGDLKWYRTTGRVTGEELDGLSEYDADHVVAHTRFATRGQVNEDNAHPFPVAPEGTGRPTALLCHNGTWYEAPRDGDNSDTWHMARRLEEFWRSSRDYGHAVRELAQLTQETFIVMTRDHTYVHSGRFDITQSSDGKVVASSGYDEIPSGEVLVL